MNMGTRSICKRIQPRDAQKSAALLRVPQRPVGVCELLSYAILPFLFIMAGAMPTAALPVMPAIIVLLYLLFRRFGAYFPAACVAGYAAVALTFNYDILTVIYSVALLFALVGLCLSAQCASYLAAAAVAALFSIVGAMSGVAVVRIAEGKPIADIAASYVTAESDDFVIDFFARDYYDNGVKLNVGETKLKPSDKGYKEATIGFFADWASDEMGEYVWYYCIHYGAIVAAAASFFVGSQPKNVELPRRMRHRKQPARKHARSRRGKGNAHARRANENASRLSLDVRSSRNDNGFGIAVCRRLFRARRNVHASVRNHAVGVFVYHCRDVFRHAV